MTLFLVRHGESEANRTARFAGWQNVPLTDIGREQARRLTAFFENIPLEAVYASDLTRAMETAAPLSQHLGLPLRTDEGLREAYAGEWEGLTFDELRERYAADYAVWLSDIGRARCTGGESMEEVAIRLDATCRRLAEQHPHGNIAVVSHGGALRAVLTLWSTGSLAAMAQTPWLSNTSVTEVTYENGAFCVVRAGMTDHLQELVTSLPPTV